MYDFIASSFFQKKTCHLPGIGKLSFININAETDFVNNQIKAPQQSIVFTPTDSQEQIFNEFSAICEMIQRQLLEVGLFEIAGIGTFTKDEGGNIHFNAIQLDPVFTQPVTAENVKRPAIQTPVSTDSATANSEVINEAYSEETEAIVTKKSTWWIWAIVFGLLSVALIAWYVYKFGIGNLGNCSPL